MKTKWIKVKRTWRLWLPPVHIVSLVLWKRDWWRHLWKALHYGFIYWLQRLAGYEYVGWEGGGQRDFWIGPFRFEWWTYAGSEDARRYWDKIWEKIKNE